MCAPCVVCIATDSLWALNVTTGKFWATRHVDLATECRQMCAELPPRYVWFMFVDMDHTLATVQHMRLPRQPDCTATFYRLVLAPDALDGHRRGRVNDH
eukprot:s1962_g10.t1